MDVRIQQMKHLLADWIFNYDYETWYAALTYDIIFTQSMCYKFVYKRSIFIDYWNKRYNSAGVILSF